jgi:glucosamine-phosphate N-acetyltransferase
MASESTVKSNFIENGLDGEDFLFESSLLKRVDWTNKRAFFKGEISPSNPGNNLKMRALSVQDYDQGYMNLLRQLTVVGDVTKERFEERFRAMKLCPGTYYVAVIEDTTNGQIIGTATLVVEQKFIHSAGLRARIEDVVIIESYRGLQLGKLLVETLTLLSEKLGCYKISLECKDENVKFYESFGYNPDGQRFLVQRFKE